MTRLQAVGVLLVALGLIYALLYAAWLRKRRQHTSATIAAERERHDADGAADAPTTTAGPAQLSVEGTYVSTTTAVSRLERVTVEGLGNRAKATLLVTRGTPEQLVRIERQGESTVLITGPRLVSVRRDRGMVGKFVGSNRMLVLQWRAEDGALYETGFLPRYKADLDRVESALWWHTGESRDADANQGATTDAPATAAPATDASATDTSAINAPATEGNSPS
ncbi:hypothetical protein ABEG17_19155 [Pedococcus sp. KACC 23699]|uniref:PH domain-containing protein n=1 Tax=Pedococcus sp. KACC 23699 TaxID=3149228 RepID=A0AAU7JU58_9MICO